MLGSTDEGPPRLPDGGSLPYVDVAKASAFERALRDHVRNKHGALADAIEAYGKSLLLNPKQPDVYNNMGVALRSLGKLEAAVACYRR